MPLQVTEQFQVLVEVTDLKQTLSDVGSTYQTHEMQQERTYTCLEPDAAA